MGRSVSYPKNSAATAYVDVSYMGMCGDEEGGENLHYDETIGQMDWDDFIANTITTAQNQWKSFTPCDKWLDREDRVILENQFAYIGVSEYCGLACLWLVSKQTLEEYNTYYSDENRLANLSDAWTDKIASNFSKIFAEYVKVGSFSNGEGVYKKVGAS